MLLTPTLAQPPIEIGGLRPKEGEPPIQMLLNAADWVPFTPVWNVTGQPAISLPLAPDRAAGLPIGVQLVGPPAGEELLLSLAAQLEQARPWADRRPGAGGAHERPARPDQRPGWRAPCATREVSPVELVQAHIDRAEAVART